MKRRIKLKPLAKVILGILFILIALYLFLSPFKTHTKAKDTQVKEITIQKEKVVYEPKNDILESVEETQETYQEPIQDTYTTRMTSYYPEEGETMTASGLGINNFQVNDKGWFTYNGMLVIATASYRLGSTDMRTYNLYDEIIINIDGLDYHAIVLDVCGACQKYNRIDLFASSVKYAKDTNVTVKIR